MEGSQRRASLLHLNVEPGFESLSNDYVPNVRVSSAHSPKQEESRRNLFWMCYTTERYYAQFFSQSAMIDDIDVSQALPLRGDLVERGVSCSICPFLKMLNALLQQVVFQQTERQYVHSPNVLFNHPPELTDSFVLLVKSAILLSRVRVFNRRFRMLNALGVSDMSTKTNSQTHFEEPVELNEDKEFNPAKECSSDAREVDRFRQLESDVELFIPSFPAYLQDPITQDGYIDWTLLNAHLASYSYVLFIVLLQMLISLIVSSTSAKISLHEPHADLKLNESDSDIEDFACKSSRKVVEALDDAYRLLRSMVDLVPDITLSDPYCWVSHPRSKYELSRLHVRTFALVCALQMCLGLRGYTPEVIWGFLGF